MDGLEVSQRDLERREYVLEALERLARLAEAKGDLRSALRATVYLGRICGVFRAPKRAVAQTRTPVPAAEAAPVRMFKSKHKFQGIVLDPPVPSEQLAAA
jgi:hypothetical protein